MFQSRSSGHVTYVSCSTKRGELSMSHWKRVRTIESFFAPNRSQSETEKNDTEEEQCINQEETDEDQRKLKFLDNVLLNLDKRFPVDSTNVVNAFGILSLRNVRFQNENLSTYGNEELETSLSHYGSAKKTQSGKMYQQLWMPKNADLNGTLLKNRLLESITPWATLLNYGKCSLPIIVMKSKI